MYTKISNIWQSSCFRLNLKILNICLSNPGVRFIDCNVIKEIRGINFDLCQILMLLLKNKPVQPYFLHVFRMTEIAAAQICPDVAPQNCVVRLHSQKYILCIHFSMITI